MTESEIIFKFISGGGVAALAGVAWNLRNAWKIAVNEATANERRDRKSVV